MIRTFFAIAAGAEIRARQAASHASWRGAFRGLKWVAPENLHLTLRFLGDTPTSILAPLRQSLVARLAGLAPFRARIGPAGAFGSVSVPRTLWFGISSGVTELGELAQRVESTACEHGFVPERKPWKAHLTLARNPRGWRVVGWQEALARSGLEGLMLDVNGVSLLSSTLLPRGPIYTEVWQVPLGPAPATSRPDSSSDLLSDSLNQHTP